MADMQSQPVDNSAKQRLFKTPACWVQHALARVVFRELTRRSWTGFIAARSTVG